jgi:outer membrane protein assembly factor BamB
MYRSTSRKFSLHYSPYYCINFYPTLWASSTGGSGSIVSLLISGNGNLIVEQGSTVYGFSATTGKQEFKQSHSFLGSNPLVLSNVNGDIYGIQSGTFFSLDPNTGDTIKETVIPTTISYSGGIPNINANNSILSSGIAFDGNTGDLLWKLNSTLYNNCIGPAFSPNGGTIAYYTCLVEFTNCYYCQILNAFDVRNGSLLWSFSPPNFSVQQYRISYIYCTSPTVNPYSGVIYIACSVTLYTNQWKASIFALNPTDGSILWSNTLPYSSSSTPRTMNCFTLALDASASLVYVPFVFYKTYYTSSMNVYNTMTGHRVWNHTLSSVSTIACGISSLVTNNGILFFQQASSVLYAYNATNGTIYSCYSFYSSAITAMAVGVDGTLYLGFSGGSILALDSGNGAPCTPGQGWTTTYVTTNQTYCIACPTVRIHQMVRIVLVVQLVNIQILLVLYVAFLVRLVIIQIWQVLPLALLVMIFNLIIFLVPLYLH